jgi:hypothetical protein
LNVFFQLRDYFVKFNHGPGQQNGDDGDDDRQLNQSESPPGLPEIKIREAALANRFAAFKHRLAHAAGQIGTILCLAREPVRVDDENVFSRIAVAGKHFPQKLFTFSHNSQNGNPTVTRSTHHLRLRGRKRIFPDAKRRTANEKTQLDFAPGLRRRPAGRRCAQNQFARRRHQRAAGRES